MAIRFAGSAGSYVAAGGGALPTFEKMSLLGVFTLLSDRDAYSTFFSAEKGGSAYGLGCQTSTDGTTYIMFDYTGKILCTIGGLAVGGVYGVAATSNGGGTTANGVKGYLQRLDVSGSLAVASGSFANSGYIGTLTTIKIGETAFNEPLHGDTQNFQVYNVVLTPTQIQAAWNARLTTLPPPPAPQPIRWWNMDGPNLAAACVDNQSSGALTVVGSGVSYTASWAPPAVSFSNTLTETVTVGDSFANEHIIAPTLSEFPNETVVVGDSWSAVLIAVESFGELVSLTDVAPGSLLSGTGLGPTYLSGGSDNNNPLASLGGERSTIEASRRLFGRLSVLEYNTGVRLYRCVYVSSTAAVTLKLYIERQLSVGTVAIAWGGPVNTQEPAISDQSLGPGLVFTSPADEASAINGGAIGDGDYRALWIRIAIPPGSTPPDTDSFQLTAAN
jgi:hypothetical protein